MLETLKLLLPAIIPSWRFFDTIAPSPRIEFALLKTAQDAPTNWQEFRPRPFHLPISSMLKHMFWNPRWNESLFLVSCTERLMENGAEHSSQEIVKRIQTELRQNEVNAIAIHYFQFRLVFVSRQGAELQKHITFISPVQHYFGNAIS
jgi:uncharacterized protein (UPF0248 family)